jgi:O-antigen ligase
MTSVAYAALWVFVFTMPWENLIVIQGIGAISKLMGMLAVSLAALAVLVSARIRRLHTFHVAALLFLVWVGCGVLLFNNEPELPKKFYTYLQLGLVLWMIWELAPTPKRQLGLFLAYVSGAYIAAVNTFIVYRDEAALQRRFSIENFDPNDLAMTLALSLPMAWYLGLTYRQPLLRWFCRAYVPLGILALALTGSRGGMIAGTIGLLIVPLTMTRLSPGKFVAALFLVVASGAVAVAYVPQSVITRLATTGSQVESGQLGGRMTIWRAGAEAFVKRPIVGYGAGAFAPAVRRVLGYPRVSHNSYLTVLVEQGLVGFVLYAWMFFAVLRAAMNLPTMEKRFALVMLATLAVAMLPLSWEDQKPAWFTLAAVLGLSQAVMPGRSFGRQPEPGRRSPSPSRSAPARAEPLVARLRNTGRDGRA